MNYQKKPSEEILHILKQRNVEFYDINYYAWPQTFSNTAGPGGGIGGCSMSVFTVEAYVCNDYGPTVYVCGNMFRFVDEKFEGPCRKHINQWIKIPKL